jgi:hypothetical protein
MHLELISAAAAITVCGGPSGWLKCGRVPSDAQELPEEVRGSS